MGDFLTLNGQLLQRECVPSVLRYSTYGSTVQSKDKGAFCTKNKESFGSEAISDNSGAISSASTEQFPRFKNLPQEAYFQIFDSLIPSPKAAQTSTSISGSHDRVALSQTCRTLHHAYTSWRKIREAPPAKNATLDFQLDGSFSSVKVKRTIAQKQPTSVKFQVPMGLLANSPSIDTTTKKRREQYTAPPDLAQIAYALEGSLVTRVSIDYKNGNNSDLIPRGIGPKAIAACLSNVESLDIQFNPDDDQPSNSDLAFLAHMRNLQDLNTWSEADSREQHGKGSIPLEVVAKLKGLRRYGQTIAIGYSQSFLTASSGTTPPQCLSYLAHLTSITQLTLLIETAKVDLQTFLPQLAPLTSLSSLHIILHVDFAQLASSRGKSVRALTKHETYRGLARLPGLEKVTLGYCYGQDLFGAGGGILAASSRVDRQGEEVLMELEENLEEVASVVTMVYAHQTTSLDVTRLFRSLCTFHDATSAWSQIPTLLLHHPNLLHLSFLDSQILGKASSTVARQTIEVAAKKLPKLVSLSFGNLMFCDSTAQVAKDWFLPLFYNLRQSFRSLKSASLSIQILRDRDIKLLSTYLPLANFLSACRVTGISRFGSQSAFGVTQCLEVQANINRTQISIQLPFLQNLNVQVGVDCDNAHLSVLKPRHATLVTSPVLHLDSLSLPFKTFEALPSLTPLFNLKRLHLQFKLNPNSSTPNHVPRSQIQAALQKVADLQSALLVERQRAQSAPSTSSHNPSAPPSRSTSTRRSIDTGYGSNYARFGLQQLALTVELGDPAGQAQVPSLEDDWGELHVVRRLTWIWKHVGHITWLHVGGLGLVVPSYVAGEEGDRVAVAMGLKENREKLQRCMKGGGKRELLKLIGGL